ncbi:hypothetical protein KY330_03540 [Candidatus Woesearchaeota archaeon]|nr:hypothetical protein [Candidatus Woesearchaeota archaeon]
MAAFKAWAILVRDFGFKVAFGWLMLLCGAVYAYQFLDHLCTEDMKREGAWRPAIPWAIASVFCFGLGYFLAF